MILAGKGFNFYCDLPHLPAPTWQASEKKENVRNKYLVGEKQYLLVGFMIIMGNIHTKHI